MHIVRSVGVLSVAKIMGLIYVCLGVLAIPFFLLAAFVGSLAGADRNPFAGAVGIVLAIFAPVIYGVIGFVAGAIGALLYNLFARLVGGVEVELTVQPPGPVAPYPIIPPQASRV
jgi:Transmembrane domain of unknown function (DUF3566)